ncbi:MAG: acetyltransferase, partial [Planctomycetota bacterium]
AFETLSDGYDEDMRRAKEIEPTFVSSTCAAYIFPDDPFARRVSGVYSNQLARDNPARSHALLSLLPNGDYLVSVRAPLSTKTGADDLCRQFPTGGGRKAAAGINQLPAGSLQAFLAALQNQFEAQT